MTRITRYALKAFTCLLLWGSFYAHSTAQISINDLTNYISPPKQWEVCRQDTFLLNITLPASTVINDSIRVNLTLPTGLVGGTFQSVTSGTLVSYGPGTSTPSIKITVPASGSQVIQLAYTVKAACELFDTNAVNAFPIQANHYSVSTGMLLSTASINSLPMAVSGGQFLLAHVFNKEYAMAQLGVPFARRFTYVNTGNLPFSGEFAFTDTIQFTMPNSAVNFQGISTAYLNPGSGTVVSYTVTDSVVTMNINFTNLLPNDSVVIADTLLLFDCPAISLNNTITQFTATYGCPSEAMCQLLHRPTIDFTSAQFDPNDKPEMNYVNMNIALLCPANPDLRKYAFINDSPWGTATGAASGLWMSINRFAWVTPGNNISYVDTATVHVYKMVSGSPVTIPHTYGTVTPNLSSVTAPHPYYFDFTINEIVPHGDTIFLEFTEAKVCVDSTDYWNYFNKPLYMDLLDVNARYEHPCTPSPTYGMDYSKGPWGEAKQMFKLGQFFNNLTGTVVDLQEVWMDANSTSKLAIGEQHPWFSNETYIDTAVFEIEVELVLDSGLALIADSVYLKGLNFNAPNLYASSVTVYEGDGINRGTKDIVRARFTIPGNYFQPNLGGGHQNYGATLKYSALYDSLFSNFAVSFKLQALCIYSPPGGIAHIKENFFLIYDKTCSPQCKFPIASVGDRVSINCPGCYLPGWNLSSFSAKRRNLGLVDANNNNYPDVVPLSSSPVAGPEAHEERIMKNDTLDCHIVASTSDGTNLLFSNIGFDYKFGQFSLQGGLMEHLEFLGGTGIYRIMGVPMMFTIPPAAGQLDAGDNFYIMMDKTDWLTYGLDTNTYFTKYGNGHEVELDLHFSVKDNLNTGTGADPYFSLEGMNGFMYMSGTDFTNASGGGKTDALNIPQLDIEDPTIWPPSARADLLYWCTGWEGRIITVGADFYSTALSRNFWGRIGYGPEVDPCLKIFESTSKASTGQAAPGMSDLNQNALNAFSFELRNLWQLDSIDFTIPTAYEIERFELRYQVMTPNSGGTATVLPCDETDLTYSPYLIGPSDTTWVNDSTIRIYPWSQIQNVTGFSNCATNTSFYDESKVIRIYPVLRMKDCVTTPLHYPFTNYPVKSYWTEFPLSSTNDTVITRYVSGDFTKPYFDWQVQVLNVSNSTPGTDLAWTINVGPGPNATNYAGSSVGVNNGFFWVGPANGNTSNINVQWGSSVTPAPVVGSHNGYSIYGLGKIGIGVYNGSFGGQTGAINVTADYSCAGLEGPDSLMLIFGDNCYSYPDTLVPGEVCFMDTIYLPIPYETPLLQYDDNFPAILSSCDTTGFSIEFNVVNEGNIENLQITMVPASPGIQYVPGTGTLYLNGDSVFTNPVANTFTFNNLDDFNALNGSAVFEFDMATWCNYDGSPIDFEISATNYCGDTLSPIHFVYSPLSVVSNLQMDTISIIDFTADTLMGCRDTALISITLFNSGTQPSSLNDTILMTLPAGITYLSGSPYISYVGSDLSFAVPNILPAGTTTLSFWVGASTSVGCSPMEIPVTLIGHAENICDTVTCSSTVELSSSATTLVLIKGDPQFTNIDLGSFCSGDSITVDIQNMANTNTGSIWVLYYCTSNETGPIAPCLLGNSTNFGLSPSGSYTSTTVITPLCSDCNEIMAVIVPFGRACICSSDTITATIDCDSIITPPCEFVADAGNDTTICTGDCIILNGNPGTPYPVISWSPTIGLSNPAIANPLACPPYPITYVMTVTDSVTGCSSSDSVLVYVNKRPKVATNLNMVVCSSAGPILIATYNHTTGMMTSPYFSPSPSSLAVITSSSLTIVNFPFFPGIDFYVFYPSVVGPGIYPISYSITDTTTGCMGVATGIITVNPSPSVTITGNTVLCKGASTVLTANATGVGPFTYLWSTSATTSSITTSTAGTYTVTVTGPGGCTATASTTVTYAPSSVLNIYNSAGSSVICAGTPFFLIATPGYTGYQWYNSANPSVILGTSFFFTPTTSGTYCVYAYNSYGCMTKTKCITITIAPGPDVTATIPYMTVCENSAPFSMGFHIGLSGPTYTSYFSPSGGHITSSSPGFYHSVVLGIIYTDNFNPAAAGVGMHTINYSYTDTNGCTGTASMIIQVVGPPTVSFPAIPDIDLCTWNGLPVYIPVSSTGGTTCVLTGPGVDSTTNTFDPALAGGPGTYVLTYTCTNKCGTTIKEQTVNVTEHAAWHQFTENSFVDDIYNDVVTDAQGNVYVVGTFIDETTLNGGANPDITINNGYTSQGSSFLAKYDKCANLIWVAHSVNSKLNVGNSIILDENNKLVYIAGNYSAKVEFVSSLSSASLCTSGYSQIITGPKQGAYIAQYDMVTGCLYFVEDASLSTYTDAQAITVNENNGNVFMGGRTGTTSTNATSYMRKFIPTLTGVGGTHGAPIWTVTSTGSKSIANDMDYDEINNRLWTTGSFERSITFTPGASRSTNPTPGITDAYLVGYQDLGSSVSPAGLRKGNIPTTGSTYMRGEGVAVDKLTGYPCITGTYTGKVLIPFEMNLGGGSINSITNNSTPNAYMICIDLSTLNAWARVADAGTGNANGYGVAIKSPYAYFTGNFNRDVTIDLMPANPYLVVGSWGITKSRVYASSYLIANGNASWTNVTESPTYGGHTPTSIAVDPTNNLFIVGAYDGEMSYYSGTPASGNLNSSGTGSNGFILRGYLPNGDFKVIQNDNTDIVLETPDRVSFSLKAIPNPTTGIVELVAEGLPEGADATVELHSILGLSLFKGKLTSNRYRLDISHLAVGTYLLTVIYNQQPVTIRVIKI